MPRIKVLLVHPKIPESFWSYSGALPYVGKKSSMIPLGLATVAAMFPKKNFEVLRIIDMNVERLENRVIQNADLIGVTSMIVQSESQADVVDRAHFFGKQVISGGPYPTSYPERNEGADYLVLGEAEITLPPFLNDLLNGQALRVYDEEGVIKQGRVNLEDLTHEGKPSLGLTPIPRWDLLKINKYFSMAVQASRGCPRKCEFCDIPKLNGRIPRTKSHEQLIAEFDSLYNAGWRGPVFIVDDNFIGNKPKVRKNLPAMIRWQKAHGYPYSLFTEASMELGDDANKDIRQGMADAGFDMVFGGIESIDEEVLEGMGKRQNRGNLLNKVRAIQNEGIEVTGGFIVGNDEDKSNVFDKLYDFITGAGIVVPMPGLLTALKGTPLYERLKQEGRLRGESSGNNTHHITFNFEPVMDERYLINGYVGLLRRLFDSRNYYERCRISHDHTGGKKHIRDVEGKEVQAFIKIILENVFGRPDFAFMKYAVETIARRPGEFPEVMAETVKLQHLRKITGHTVAVHRYNKMIEELYGDFMEKMRGFSGEVGKRFDKFSALEGKIMGKASKRYYSIHRDFRRGVRESFDGLRKRIGDYGKSLLIE